MCGHLVSSIEVPVLWVKVDMDMAWLANMYIQQSDTTLHHIIKYDRDAISQMKVCLHADNTLMLTFYRQ